MYKLHKVHFHLFPSWCQASCLPLHQRGRWKDVVGAIWFPVVCLWLSACPLARWLPTVPDHHAPPQALSVLSFSLSLSPFRHVSPPLIFLLLSCPSFSLLPLCPWRGNDCLSVCYFILSILMLLLSSFLIPYSSFSLFSFSLCHCLYLPVHFRIKMNILMKTAMSGAQIDFWFMTSLWADVLHEAAKFCSFGY